MPKVSVVMPLYNAEKYVRKSIESILNQSFKDFELILIDDGSTDNTVYRASEINDKRIRVYHNSCNKGIAYSRNRGLETCKGDYVALMDDDDIAPLYRLQKEVSFLDENSDIDVVGGRYCIIDKNDNIKKYWDEPLINPYYVKANLMFYDCIANGSTMFRKQFIEQHQIRYQDNCLGMEDYFFWINCSLHGKIANMRDVLLYWRENEYNETSRVMQEKEAERKALFGQMQKFALRENGFVLTEQEQLLFSEMFPENLAKKIISTEKISDLYRLLQKIIGQAEEKKMENAKEVSIACRKHFSQRLEFSDLWF